MSPLAERLKLRQAEFGKRLAALSQEDLIEFLERALGQALDFKLHNPLQEVAIVERLLMEDAAGLEGFVFDHKTLHEAIARCIRDGVMLPHAFIQILARGVAEPQTLKRKKGNTRQAFHHEIWRLCRFLKEYRQIPLTSGESKPTRAEKGDTAFGLLAEASVGIRKAYSLTTAQIRDIYYEQERRIGK